MKTGFLFAFVLFSVTTLTAQSKQDFDSLITANKATFVYSSGHFSGKGWDELVDRAGKANYVLIGEDHFISEVPVFTQALVQQVKFDNYICEIDQWMLNIFKQKISALNAAQLDAWISANQKGFSFFQKKNEFELAKKLIDQKVNLIGIEQVGLMSTTIIFQYLVETGNKKNKKLYEALRDSSTVTNNKFFSDYDKPFFLLTDYFTKTFQQLDKSVMNADEAELVNALVSSSDIYKTGSHQKRVKLMQSNLMKLYPQTLKGRRTLFKFGANHSMKGESYLPVYDIGTTAHVLAQSENQDSYHILILPKAGEQAGFLEGSSAIDLSQEPFNSLNQFFKNSSDNDWTIIDLEKIRNVVRKKKIVIDNPFLQKTIKGYDVLVIIPRASAAQAVK